MEDSDWYCSVQTMPLGCMGMSSAPCIHYAVENKLYKKKIKVRRALWNKVLRLKWRPVRLTSCTRTPATKSPSETPRHDKELLCAEIVEYSSPDETAVCKLPLPCPSL